MKRILIFGYGAIAYLTFFVAILYRLPARWAPVGAAAACAVLADATSDANRVILNHAGSGRQETTQGGALGRAAAVVGNGGDVADRGDLEADRLQRA